MAQCTAHRTDGAPCRNGSIPGGTVCRYHGGSAPQVQAKARERLAALVDPAISKYEPLLNCGIPQVTLNAVKDILDRTGYKPIERVEQTTVNAEEVEVLSLLSDEQLDRVMELRQQLDDIILSARGSADPKPPEDL